ncbi:hypothetical protein [Devosia sp. A449]
MTAIETYPECLRRPDAGGYIQTRTDQTEARYRTRFAGMIRTLCKQKPRMAADAHSLATDLSERAWQYAANTLKQYHATIRQNLRDRWDDGSIIPDEIEEIDALLRAQQPAPRKQKPRQARTSAGRAKSARPEQIAAIASVLLIDPTPIRQIAAAMLEHGVNLATRPGEFLTIKRDPRGRFWVRSAKYSLSNRRGLQAARTVPIDDYEPREIAELQVIADMIAAERSNGATTPKLLRRCQRAIRLARKDVGGRSRKIAAYTVRHQSRANLAAMDMTPGEIAVIMGHASAGTAQSHYAPARRAWRGMANRTPPAVDAALVAMVRPTHRSRGWDVGRANMTVPGPKFGQF